MQRPPIRGVRFSRAFQNAAIPKIAAGFAMNSLAVLRFGFSKKASHRRRRCWSPRQQLPDEYSRSQYVARGLYTEENELVLGSELAGGFDTVAKPLIVIDPLWSDGSAAISRIPDRNRADTPRQPQLPSRYYARLVHSMIARGIALTSSTSSRTRNRCLLLQMTIGEAKLVPVRRCKVAPKSSSSPRGTEQTVLAASRAREAKSRVPDPTPSSTGVIASTSSN